MPLRSRHPYGNYVVQQLFEHGNSEQRACAVQKLVKNAPRSEIKVQLRVGVEGFETLDRFCGTAFPNQPVQQQVPGIVIQQPVLSTDLTHVRCRQAHACHLSTGVYRCLFSHCACIHPFQVGRVGDEDFFELNQFI